MPDFIRKCTNLKVCCLSAKRRMRSNKFSFGWQKYSPSRCLVKESCECGSPHQYDFLYSLFDSNHLITEVSVSPASSVSGVWWLMWLLSPDNCWHTPDWRPSLLVTLDLGGCVQCVRTVCWLSSCSFKKQTLGVFSPGSAETSWDLHRLCDSDSERRHLQLAPQTSVVIVAEPGLLQGKISLSKSQCL